MGNGENMAKKYFIGIDLGGTSIKLGLVSLIGELIDSREIPTRKTFGFQTIIKDIVKHAKFLVLDANIPWNEVQGMGLGLPGLLHLEKGIVRLAPNLNWQNVPIKWFLEEQLHIPIKIENDGNVAALGEAWMGAGKSYRHMIMATIGTGIGAGIMIDGEILHGKQGMAAELGHLPISEEGLLCGCGNYGCLETVSSATGIINKGKEVILQQKESLLTEQYADDIEQLSAKNVFDAAKSGDKEALQIVNRAGRLLGKGLAITANLFDPEIIIIGGGVSQAGEILFEPIKEGFRQNSLKQIADSVEITPATLGNTAGMIGAASLFK